MTTLTTTAYSTGDFATRKHDTASVAATREIVRVEPNDGLRPWRGLSPGRARRAMDVAVSLAVLTLAGLPLLLLMGLIRLESRGPAIFKQIRVGQGERVFTLLKLRSMRADLRGSDLTSSGDARITRVGRLIRATSVDELPQLINVLKGSMTLVGPRPETPYLAAQYPAQCRWVFSFRPGLTGPAQVRMRDTDVLNGASDQVEAYLRLVVPVRARIEAKYLSCPSIPATVAVLVDTFRHISGLEVHRR